MFFLGKRSLPPAISFRLKLTLMRQILPASECRWRFLTPAEVPTRESI